jgi:ABC-type bacteriocin/lantibiotic exporter with double-glycine peptidase domain
MMHEFRSYLFEIYFLAGKKVRKLKLIFILFLLIGAFDLIGLSLIGQFVALAFGANSQLLDANFKLDDSDKTIVGFLLIVVFACKTVLGVWSNKRIFSTAAEVEANLRIQLLQKFLCMSYQNWSRRNSSEYINAINVWVPQYSRLVLMSLIRVVAESVVACLILSFLFLVDPIAFSILLGLITGVAILYDRLLRRKNKTYADRFKAVSALVITDVRQAMDGFKEIRILGAEKFFVTRISNNSTELCSAQASSNTISNSAKYFLEFAVVVFAVLVPLAASDSSERAVDIVPILAIFGAGAMRLVSLFSLFTSALTQLTFYRQIVHSLYSDLNQNQIFKLESNLIISGDNFKKVRIKNLSFKYIEGTNYVLQNVDLEINRGDKIIFSGRSGGGKSTLIDLMLGIISPSEGSIDVVGIENKLLGHHVGAYSVYLPQSTFLIDDSIRRNIALGQEDKLIDDIRLNIAIKRTRLAEVIDALPMGINTVIGDRGIRLSGGQRQRIALARAFYFGKTILFLDEATSAIDASNEEAILSDLLTDAEDLTIIYITHRVEMAFKFDRHYEVNGGKVKLLTDFSISND